MEVCGPTGHRDACVLICHKVNFRVLPEGLAEVRARHCLDARVRRFCAYEFFCSALDRPWFMRNELKEYLVHIGIAPGTKLMRPELAIIRASLGRPRRLSLTFLRQVVASPHIRHLYIS